MAGQEAPGAKKVDPDGSIWSSSWMNTSESWKCFASVSAEL